MHQRGPVAGRLERDSDLAQLQEGRVLDIARGCSDDCGGHGRLPGKGRAGIVQGSAATVEAAQVLGRVELTVAGPVLEQRRHADPTAPGQGRTERSPLRGERRAEEHRRRPNQDRKSTRLNSSHLVISYAVFCLKKKKKEEEW